MEVDEEEGRAIKVAKSIATGFAFLSFAFSFLFKPEVEDCELVADEKVWALGVVEVELGGEDEELDEELDGKDGLEFEDGIVEDVESAKVNNVGEFEEARDVGEVVVEGRDFEDRVAEDVELVEASGRDSCRLFTLVKFAGSIAEIPSEFEMVSVFAGFEIMLDDIEETFDG